MLDFNRSHNNGGNPISQQTGESKDYQHRDEAFPKGGQ